RAHCGGGKVAGLHAHADRGVRTALRDCERDFLLPPALRRCVATSFGRGAFRTPGLERTPRGACANRRTVALGRQRVPSRGVLPQIPERKSARPTPLYRQRAAGGIGVLG